MLGKLKTSCSFPSKLEREFENLELGEEAALLSLIEHESLKLASGSLDKRSTRKPRIILILGRVITLMSTGHLLTGLCSFHS